ncbi:MAG: Ti-type conjugative transfer relaxase TraA [Proteobacteria bacterium]|nr:Ti-type conjugative transfer relaxase TraA [Pseudomonadota bacterium]
MPMYSVSVRRISRRSGRSAVAAAAYRAGERLIDERQKTVHDYRGRDGVIHTEIVLPDGVDFECSRSELWNAAERAERRADATTAREILVALPRELNHAQRLVLARRIARYFARRYGVAVDFALHLPSTDGDDGNHHVHILITTRKITPTGLGEKSDFELSDAALRARGLPTGAQQIEEIRAEIERLTNLALARAGVEARVDHRSYRRRGIEIEPQRHQGPGATDVERRGGEPDRPRLTPEAAEYNAAQIELDPGVVLRLVTARVSVFTRAEIAKEIARHVDVDAAEFQALLARVLAHPDLVRLTADRRDSGGALSPEIYSTRALVRLERGMLSDAQMLAVGRRHPVAPGATKGAAAEYAVEHGYGLTDEQISAVDAVTGPAGIAVITGVAGGGKSTALDVARRAWRASGYQVLGAALSGQAARGLQAGAGIASRTVASLLHALDGGYVHLDQHTILVVDEAAMLDSHTLADLVRRTGAAGAKIVLVGDAEQLQPIGPGAGFRALAERLGCVRLDEIHRQRDPSEASATARFAAAQTAAGLGVYAATGAIQGHATVSAARGAIAKKYVANWGRETQMALAHRRADVAALNREIRDRLRAADMLGVDHQFDAESGTIVLAVGDRLVFLRNDRRLGVVNGTAGSVIEAHDDTLRVLLDDGAEIVVKAAEYRDIAYGYATTIHKSQGRTLDRTYVLASRTMDRHMTYVSMSRHRNGVEMLYGADEFSSYDDLVSTLSRSGLKETTLDFEEYDFAVRRGVVPDSQIWVDPGSLEPPPAEPPERAAERLWWARLAALVARLTTVTAARQAAELARAEAGAALEPHSIRLTQAARAVDEARRAREAAEAALTAATARRDVLDRMGVRADPAWVAARADARRAAKAEHTARRRHDIIVAETKPHFERAQAAADAEKAARVVEKDARTAMELERRRRRVRNRAPGAERGHQEPDCGPSMEA